jgi:hypothetical protein
MMEQILKRCSKCGDEKPLSEFHKAKHGKFGFAADCKICKNNHNTKYRSRPEAIEKRDEWLKSHPNYTKEYCKSYYLEHQDKIKKRTSDWYKNNIEKATEYFEEYYLHIKDNFPWLRTLAAIKQRCENSNCKAYKWYGGRGIKCQITAEELKEIWYRDKADLLECASIDRIDNDGDYTFDNCQYIELVDNVIKENLYRRNKKVVL